MWVVISLLVGLGIFLFGMQRLEQGLQTLGSDKVRYWLGKSTQHPLGSVATGTVITAILQSSSMVSLIVLAFASAGMIQLFNAVGVILGANLGTTFTGWVVATVGFKMDLEAIALPCFGIGALVYVFSEAKSRRHALSEVVIGFGLLIFGLSLMKDSVSDLPQILSPELLKSFSLPMFLLVGMLMTAVIQSSSAMTLIALTALNAGIIDLSSAGALVVGADIGTTSTTALGSLKAPPIAKQLALAHVIYNLTVDAVAFIVLIPVLPAALDFIGVSDPLYGLVLFHSSFNLLGLFFFVPFLKPFSRWLSEFFNHKEAPYSRYLQTPAQVPEAGVQALQNELECLLTDILSLNLRNLKIDPAELDVPGEIQNNIISTFKVEADFDARYKSTKELEGEMFRYASQVRVRSKSEQLNDELSTILDCARDAIYAMKTLKDVRPDLVLFRHILNDTAQSKIYLDRLKHIYEVMIDTIFVTHKESYLAQKLNWLRQQNESLHNELHESILSLLQDHNRFKHDELATVLNTNREIWHSNRNLFDAIEHRLALKDKTV